MILPTARWTGDIWSQGKNLGTALVVQMEGSPSAVGWRSYVQPLHLQTVLWRHLSALVLHLLHLLTPT